MDNETLQKQNADLLVALRQVMDKLHPHRDAVAWGIVSDTLLKHLPPCSGCNPAEGFCRTCRDKEKSDKAAAANAGGLRGAEAQVLFDGEWKPASENAFYCTSEKNRRVVDTPAAADAARLSTGHWYAQEFLNWNRSQEKPPVAIGKELGVARKVMEFAEQHSRADTSAAALPDGYVLMPERLTAENSAKAALSGEFSETYMVTCHECDGSGDDASSDSDAECPECKGDGEVQAAITVGWDTIKEIYARAVEVCAHTPTAKGAGGQA